MAKKLARPTAAKKNGKVKLSDRDKKTLGDLVKLADSVVAIAQLDANRPQPPAEE